MKATQMARPRLPIPTPAEQRALHFLHEKGSSTVREYLEGGELGKGKAYTSVMSLMNVMFEKGLATRTEERRAFRYKPTMTAEELRAMVLENVLSNTFRGDLEALKAAVTSMKPGKRK
jgi:BlaI family penicillinase repressor